MGEKEWNLGIALVRPAMLQHNTGYLAFVMKINQSSKLNKHVVGTAKADE